MGCWLVLGLDIWIVDNFSSNYILVLYIYLGNYYIVLIRNEI